jgi:hypothetical protein
MDGWAFLVARGRQRGYRSILVPDFLLDTAEYGLLTENVRGDVDPAGPPRVEQVTAPATGRLALAYRSRRLLESDLDAGQPVTDMHGRPLDLLYGFVSRGRVPAPSEADLAVALGEALAAYRCFLAGEAGFAVRASHAFALRSVAADVAPLGSGSRGVPSRGALSGASGAAVSGASVSGGPVSGGPVSGGGSSRGGRPSRGAGSGRLGSGRPGSGRPGSGRPGSGRLRSGGGSWRWKVAVGGVAAAVAIVVGVAVSLWPGIDVPARAACVLDTRTRTCAAEVPVRATGLGGLAFAGASLAPDAGPATWRVDEAPCRSAATAAACTLTVTVTVPASAAGHDFATTLTVRLNRPSRTATVRLTASG